MFPLHPPTGHDDRGVSIAEASRPTGVSAHTLRYYERAGLVVGPVETDCLWASGQPGYRRGGNAEPSAWHARLPGRGKLEVTGAPPDEPRPGETAPSP